MTDTALLRRRLVRALDLAPLAVAALGLASACTSAEQAAERQRLEAAKQREQWAREVEATERLAREAEAERVLAERELALAEHAAKQAKLLEEAKLAEPQQPMPHFSCPSGEWCGSKGIAKRYAGGRRSDHPSALGCPGVLEPHEGGDPKQDPPSGMGYAYLDEAATETKRAEGQANLCCYDWGSYCGGGRPLLDEGQPRFAALERIDGGSSKVDVDVDVELDPRIGLGWLDDARMEHASIASFVRAEAELAALAAPLALREACLRAAEDERRHARECFAIAAEYGQAWRAGELPRAPLREASLAQLAVDTLREGGIGETIAALMATRAARAARPELARTLEAIAADELEHAALAWQTIAWAVQQGGDSVREALRSAADQDRSRLAELERASADPNAETLARHGRLDARAKARAIGDAWRELIDPLLVELGVGSLLQRSRPSIATN